MPADPHQMHIYRLHVKLFSAISAKMATKVVANPEIDILKEEREGRLREVGNQAVWSLSSCKPGINI